MGHHHHHHNKHGHHQPPPPPPSGPLIDPYTGYGYGQPSPYYAQYAPPPPLPLLGPTASSIDPYRQQQLQGAIADRNRHARNEHVAEAAAVGAGAFALYEAHEAKVDPAHARRHKLEAEVAGAVALGSAAYAWHEHSQKKKDEHRIESLQGGGHGHGRKHDGHNKHQHRPFW